VVRGAHLGSRPPRRARRHRSHGRHESADLGQGRGRDRVRRIPALRLHQADAEVQVPRGHHRHRSAADRDLQSRIYRCAPAPAVQEYRLCRSALCAPGHGPRGHRAARRRAVPLEGKADPSEPPCAPSRARLGAEESAMPDRAAPAPCQGGRGSHLHRRQFGRGAGGRLWRRERVRLVSDHAVILAGGCLHQPLQAAAGRSRDQEEQGRDRAGGGRARFHRHGDRRRLERRARAPSPPRRVPASR